MCGLTGFISDGYTNDGAFKKHLLSMSNTIIHRGPDSSGIWFDDVAGVGLAHTRLSILELSSAGGQPMHSLNNRYVIIFNGEIYNHQELREIVDSRLSGMRWRGSSDTETLIECISLLGFETTMNKIEGMFAFVLWDKQEKDIYLVRDRFGEKPLYYGCANGFFLFGSELKSLKSHPAFCGNIDVEALKNFMRLSYVSQPKTIYEGIRQLPPGAYLKVPLSVLRSGKDFAIDPVRYWDLLDVVVENRRAGFPGTDQEAVNSLDIILRDAVLKQIQSDVPVGAFLSGGIDSSTITAIMKEVSNEPVKTFTIGFFEGDFNEANKARRIADHLGTDHTELYVSGREALDVVPQLPAIYDEPFADSSQIPTFLISRLAASQVKVSLSGDAGDEVFGGYNRYTYAYRLFDYVSWAPNTLRGQISKILRQIPDQAWKLIGSALSIDRASERVDKFLRIVSSKDLGEMYHLLLATDQYSDRVFLDQTGENVSSSNIGAAGCFKNFQECMMYLDSIGYLPNDILAKVDRAAMNVSLETRMPYLDLSVIDFSWKLPLSMKIRDGQGKWILREVLRRYVPDTLTRGSKRGFSVPLSAWLRGPLRDWAEDLISSNRLDEQKLFCVDLVRSRWSEHLKGTRDWQYFLWNMLVFQAWIADE